MSNTAPASWDRPSKLRLVFGILLLIAALPAVFMAVVGTEIVIRGWETSPDQSGTLGRLAMVWGIALAFLLPGVYLARSYVMGMRAARSRLRG